MTTIENLKVLERDMRKGTHNLIASNYLSLEDLCECIEALEKQIPMTPECIHDNKSVIMGRCPRCGKIVNNVQNGCPNCIGALDWSDEE